MLKELYIYMDNKELMGTTGGKTTLGKHCDSNA